MLFQAPAPDQQEVILDVSIREFVSLSGIWRAQVVDQFREEMARPEYDDSGWRSVYAPASWSEQGWGVWIGQPKLIVYRRTVDVPDSWKGKAIGINAWFNPYDSVVFVNGRRVEPARRPFAPYAEVSTLLYYGQSNTITVLTTYEGFFEMTEAGPPRLGPIEPRRITRILKEELEIPAPGGPASATLVRPAIEGRRIALVLIATGSHGMGVKADWLDLAEDLAHQGFVSLAVALKIQDPEGVLAAVHCLREYPFVDPGRIVLIGADAGGKTVLLAALRDSQIAGVALISAPFTEEIAQIGQRPVLLMAAVDDQGGRVLQQAQAMAERCPESCKVHALPGSGHGAYTLRSAWNAVRRALLSWLPSPSASHPIP